MSDPRQVAMELEADERILWLGVKHFSTGCAAAVSARIREVEPAAVLVEAPDDATSLIPWILDGETHPPVAILSTFTDKANKLGQNGKLTASDDIPARFRSWWPLVDGSPEYEALRAGDEVGAELLFIDAPLRTTATFQVQLTESVSDRSLAESRYYKELALRTQTASFEDFWHAQFDVVERDPGAFQRAVHTFAAAARALASPDDLEREGSLLREAHMRSHIDAALKRHKGRRIAVVVGALHAVALPRTKRKKAGRSDKSCQTLLVRHSYPALARLYGLNRRPQWTHDLWQARQYAPAPLAADHAATLAIARAARLGKQALGIGTDEVLAAVEASRALAQLRGGLGPIPTDIEEAMVLAAGKVDGASVAADAMQRSLVGEKTGSVCAEAGEVPLIEDYYRVAKAHRINVSGVEKRIRCDTVGNPKHRQKSGALHRMIFLGIPCFGRPAVRGPDLLEGTDLHLLTETFTFRWSEDVDDALLEASALGVTLEEAAASMLAERMVSAGGDSSELAAVVLSAGKMDLGVWVDKAMEHLEFAVSREASFDRTVRALQHFSELRRFRGTLRTTETTAARLESLTRLLHQRACLLLPTAARCSAEQVEEAIDRVRSLARLTHAMQLSTGPLDAELLEERLEALWSHEGRAVAVKGAALGLLVGARKRSGHDVVRAVRGLAEGRKAADLGDLLDGLFRTARFLLLRDPTLLSAIHEIVAALPDALFVEVLPALRRAFTAFTPEESHRIGEAVADALGRSKMPQDLAPAPTSLRALDASVWEQIDRWS